MSRRIGILRCLLYYPFFPYWKAFFEDLDFELVVSSPMTGESYDRGARGTVGDICLPISSVFTHLQSLRGQVDSVFVPRLNRLHKDVYVCPACAGLPYVVRHSDTGIPVVLSINLTPFADPDRADYRTLAKLGRKRRQVRAALARARGVYEDFVESSRKSPHLDAAITRFTGGTPKKVKRPPANGPNVLLLGMPYVLADSFINQGVPDLLADRGCRIFTPFMIAPETAGAETTLEGYLMYWTFGGMSLAAMTRFVENHGVDAIIYCSSFACGVDSLITPVVQSACWRCYDLPYLLLVVDEHAENSHLEVRIEAFLDCIDTRRGRQVVP